MLLVPRMGRHKYSMWGKLQGRNMLLAEYLKIIYLMVNEDGVNPLLEDEKARKKVSSHLQVLKNFMKHHRCCKSLRPRVDCESEHKC